METKSLDVFERAVAGDLADSLVCDTVLCLPRGDVLGPVQELQVTAAADPG
jgi:hypothetical protein